MATRTIDGKVVTEITTNGVAAAAPRHQVGRTAGVVWGLLRIAMGWTFLWAFLDKAFALGFSTGRNRDRRDRLLRQGRLDQRRVPDGRRTHLRAEGSVQGLYDGLAGRRGSSGLIRSRCC